MSGVVAAGASRAVSWEDAKSLGDQKRSNSKAETDKQFQQVADKKSEAETVARNAENEKLRELVSIRRGSSQASSIADQKLREPHQGAKAGGGGGGQGGTVGRGGGGAPEKKTLEVAAAECPPVVRGASKMTDDARTAAAPRSARPLLVRGSSCNPQQALKTSERPPLSRGFSVQARRNYPSITITRPHSTIEDGLNQPKIDILDAVSEIHDNFKENTRAYEEDYTEADETEDEFHEQLQGGAPGALVSHLTATQLTPDCPEMN